MMASKNEEKKKVEVEINYALSPYELKQDSACRHIIVGSNKMCPEIPAYQAVCGLSIIADTVVNANAMNELPLCRDCELELTKQINKALETVRKNIGMIAGADIGIQRQTTIQFNLTIAPPTALSRTLIEWYEQTLKDDMKAAEGAQTHVDRSSICTGCGNDHAACKCPQDKSVN